MKKQWVKFLKDHDNYKAGATVELDEDVATSLKTLKFAEFITSPEPDVLGEAMKSLSGKVDEMVKRVTDGIGKEIQTKVAGIKMPAMPIDHDEAGRNGFKCFDEFLKAIQKAGPAGPLSSNLDERLTKIKTAGDPTGQNVANDAEGGFLVPTSFAQGIREIMQEDESILPATDQYTTSSDNLEFIGMIETSRKSGFRHNGALAYWLSEAEQFTASKIKFHKMAMKLHKLGALMYATEESLADSQYALAPIMQRKMGQALRFAVNDAIFNGTGVGQPSGVFRALWNGNTGGPVIRVNSSTEPVEVGIRHLDIRNMYHAMHPAHRARAVWYMHPNMFEKLELVTFNDAGTIPIMRVGLQENSLQRGLSYTLYGRPIVISEHCQDLGDVGDIMFADMSQYATLTKAGGGIQVAESIHIRFLYEEKAFRASMRIDGMPMWPAPVQDLNGNRYRSPFVVLGARNSGASSSGL